MRGLGVLLCVGALLLVACGEDEPKPSCGADEMVAITAPALGINFMMDKYEASRDDASSSDQGSGSLACSQAGVLPWTGASYDEAKAACEAAGKRLCTQEEWESACRSLGRDSSYPYGAYEAGRCNGDGVSEGVVVTGQMTECETLQGVFDMSGNAREWTEPEADAGAARMGGSYSSGEIDLGCSVAIVVEGGVGPGDGFRCCANAVE